MAAAKVQAAPGLGDDEDVELVPDNCAALCDVWAGPDEHELAHRFVAELPRRRRVCCPAAGRV